MTEKTSTCEAPPPAQIWSPVGARLRAAAARLRRPRLLSHKERVALFAGIYPRCFQIDTAPHKAWGGMQILERDSLGRGAAPDDTSYIRYGAQDDARQGDL